MSTSVKSARQRGQTSSFRRGSDAESRDCPVPFPYSAHERLHRGHSGMTSLPARLLLLDFPPCSLHHTPRMHPTVEVRSSIVVLCVGPASLQCVPRSGASVGEAFGAQDNVVIK